MEKEAYISQIISILKCLVTSLTFAQNHKKSVKNNNEKVLNNMNTKLTKEKIEQHYNEVKEVITTAVQDSFVEEYNNAEENAFAQNIKEQLAEINEAFKKEIEELEQSSEWDKFCISFFGETNAGKSTIIESLRIIYNEESRLQKIMENQQSLQEALNENNKAFSELNEQTENFKKLLKNKKKPISVKLLILSITTSAILASAITVAILFLV